MGGGGLVIIESGVPVEPVTREVERERDDSDRKDGTEERITGRGKGKKEGGKEGKIKRHRERRKEGRKVN